MPMTKVLYVIPGLDHGGPAKQVGLLVDGLPGTGFDLRVSALAGTGPAAIRFINAGVPVDVLGGTRLVNLAAIWRLRRLIRDFQPDVIHSWGRGAVRAVAWAGGRSSCRLLANSPFTPERRHCGPGRLDRWLLHRVDKFVAIGSY